jgi:hypothetical protein
MTKKPPVKKPVSKPAKTAAAVKTSVAAKPKPVAAKSTAASKIPAEKRKGADARPNGAMHKAAANPNSKAKPVLEQKEKIKKPKLVRDSFTMPEAEYQVLGDVKKACIRAGFEVKKSELLRIGAALIQKMDTAALKEALAALPPLKAGRPKKEK